MNTLKLYEKIIAGVLITIVFTLFVMMAYNVIYHF